MLSFPSRLIQQGIFFRIRWTPNNLLLKKRCHNTRYKKRKKNFLKTSSHSVLVNERPRVWKVIKLFEFHNKSGNFMVGTLAENQILKRDTKSILNTYFRSHQIDIKSIFSDHYTELAKSENLKLESTSKDSFLKLWKKCLDFKSKRNWSNFRKNIKGWNLNFSRTY